MGIMAYEIRADTLSCVVGSVLMVAVARRCAGCNNV